VPKKTKSPRPPAKAKNLVGKLMCSTHRLNLYIGYKGPGSNWKPGFLYAGQNFVVLRATPHKQKLIRDGNVSAYFLYDLEILAAGTDTPAALLSVDLKHFKEVTIGDE